MSSFNHAAGFDPIGVLGNRACTFARMRLTGIDIVVFLPITWKSLIHGFLQIWTHFKHMDRAAGMGAGSGTVKALGSGCQQQEVDLVWMLVSRGRCKLFSSRLDYMELLDGFDCILE